MDSFPTSMEASSSLEQASDLQKSSSWKELLTCDFNGKPEVLIETSAVFLQFKDRVFWQIENGIAMWNTKND